MDELVYLERDEAVCSSLDVSRSFGKRHDNVLRAIGGLLENEETQKMFKKLNYVDSQNKQKYPMYLNGYQIGQKRLFEWLRSNGYLIKSGSSRNMPQQRYVEQGLFEVKESNFQNPDGSVRITRTTKVSGKGQIYFINKFKQMEG